MALFRHRAQGTFPEGEVWSFALHTTGSLTTAGANGAWQTAYGLWWTDFAPAVCTDIVTTELSTGELDQPTGKQQTRTSAQVGLAGTNATPCLPFQCAPVVTLRTATANKFGIGRFYAPSLAVDQIMGSRIQAPGVTAMVDGAQAMLQSLVGAGLTPVLYSSTDRQTRQIINLDVGNVIDTQRRRRNKLTEVRTSASV